MFKMGCSMARKILAIDGKGNSAAATTSAPEAGLSFDNQPNQGGSQTKRPKEAGGGGAAKQEELNDFSKLEEDPRLPLNVRQIFKITKSWKAIARTMSKTGTAMFLNLFEQNQDLFYLFSRFQHLKGKELHESMELREHAATVMSTLDQSINSLSDYDNFVTYLHSIGKLHRKVPGFKREHFWKIEQPFLRAVKHTLDERCNETIEEIYRIAIKLIIETIAEGYGEDQPEPEGSMGEPSNENGSGNGDAGHAGGDKSSGARQSDGGGLAASKGAAGDSNGRTPARRDGQKGSADNKGRQQQQQWATITSQSGENDRQNLAACSQSATASAAAIASATKAERANKQARLGPSKRKHNQGGVCQQNGSAADGGHGRESQSEREDRLKTTMVCLKELLSLAVRGVSEREQRHKLQDLAACERLPAEPDTKIEQSEPETRSGVNGSGKPRKLQSNECAALIGFSSNNNNNNLPMSSELTSKGPQSNRRGLFGRLPVGLDSLFIIVNGNGSGSGSERAKRKAALSKGSAGPLRPVFPFGRAKHNKATLESAEIGTEREQFNERHDASPGKSRAHLIGGGKLSMKLPTDVVKRIDDDRDRQSKDNYSEPAGDCRWFAASQLDSSCSPSCSGFETPSAGCCSMATGSDVRGRRAEQTTTTTTIEQEAPRSIGDKTSKATANMDRNASCQLRKWSPLRPIDGRHQDQTVGPMQHLGSWPPDADRYSARLCDETNSKQRPSDAGRQRPGEATARLAVASTAAMHSRDHNNDRTSLMAAPNEQPDDDDEAKISQTRPATPIGKPTRGDADEWLTNANGVGLSFRGLRIKQSSSSPSLATGRRIALPLSRAHKFRSTSMSGSHPSQMDGRSSKVNESKDLVRRVNGGDGSGECNYGPMCVHTRKDSHQGQFAMSGQGRRPDQRLGPTTRQLSCFESPQQTPRTTTSTRPSEGRNKQAQSKRRQQTGPTAPAKLASQLTSNAGDLGELIKMLMHTLLTYNSSGSGNT